MPSRKYLFYLKIYESCSSEDSFRPEIRVLQERITTIVKSYFDHQGTFFYFYTLKHIKYNDTMDNVFSISLVVRSDSFGRLGSVAFIALQKKTKKLRQKRQSVAFSFCSRPTQMLDIFEREIFPCEEHGLSIFLTIVSEFQDAAAFPSKHC